MGLSAPDSLGLGTVPDLFHPPHPGSSSLSLSYPGPCWIPQNWFWPAFTCTDLYLIVKHLDVTDPQSEYPIVISYGRSQNTVARQTPAFCCSGKRLIIIIISGNFLQVQILRVKSKTHWNQWVLSDPLNLTSDFIHICNVFRSWKEIGVNLNTVTLPLCVGEALLHWEHPYIVMFKIILMSCFWNRLYVFINFW